MTAPALAVAAVYARDWIGLRSSDRPKLTRPDLDRVLAAGFSAIDIRLENIARGPSPHELALAKVVLAAGVPLRCHAWVGRVDPATNTSVVRRADGLRDGRNAGRAAALMGSQSFAANPEYAYWRALGGGANPRAADALDGLAEAFYEENRDQHLNHVGFADPSWHYGKGDTDGDGQIDSEIPLEVQRRYHWVYVMAYQSDYIGVKKRMDTAKAVWTMHADSHVEPWLGVGRVDKRDGQVGSYDASMRMIRQHGCGTGYVGAGAIPQLLVGHPGHASLAHMAMELRGGAHVA